MGPPPGNTALAIVDLRARWRRNWRGALALIVILGATGGLSVGAAAAARRTTNAFEHLLRDIDAPDALMIAECPPAVLLGCGSGTGPSDSTGPPRDIAQQVERYQTLTTVLVVLETRSGVNPNVQLDNPTGCFDQDRSSALAELVPGDEHDQPVPFRLRGSLPAPGSNGIVLTNATAARIGAGIGDELVLRGWCAGEDADGDPLVETLAEPVALRVTGLSVGPLDVEPPGDGLTLEPLFVDPAVIAPLLAAGADGDDGLVSVWLTPTSTVDERQQVLQSDFVVSDIDRRARDIDDGLRADARLLWVLAAAVAAIGALVALPLAARHVEQSSLPTAVLGALGATSTQRRWLTAWYAATIGAGAAAVAAVAACVVAPALPRGLGESVEPDLGPWFDPLVVPLGAIGLTMVVVAGSVVRQFVLDGAHDRRARGTVGAAGSALGVLPLRPPEITGVRAALAPTREGAARPVAVMVALVLAVGTVTASLTFLAGLRQLEGTPALAGWTWDGFVAPAPGTDARELRDAVAAIPGVAAASLGTVFPPVILRETSRGAEVWPIGFDTGPGSIAPAIIQGRAPAGPGEVAVDVTMARDLGVTVGEVVTLDRPHRGQQLADNLAANGGTPLDASGLEPLPVELTVVGVSLLPLQESQAIWQLALTLDGMEELVRARPGEDEEALALLGDAPAELRTAVEAALTDPLGPSVWVYIRTKFDPTLAMRDRLATTPGAGEAAVVPREQVLGEILGLNLSRADRVPPLLAIVLSGLGAAIAAYQIHGAVRARSRELQILGSLGFTGAHVRRSGAAQACTFTLGPVVAGALVGAVVGRWVWRDYAESLHVVPAISTPWVWCLVIPAGVVVVAVLAALTGASSIARDRGTHLRTE